MKLGALLELVAGERAAFPPEATGTLPDLCDGIDALVAVIQALPKCDYMIDFGHGLLGKDRVCEAPATKRNRFGHACEKHAAEFGTLGWYDLTYGPALRRLLGGAS